MRKKILSFVLTFAIVITGMSFNYQPVEAAETSVKLDWSKFSSRYYYNFLNEDQKEFWDEMDRVCYTYLTTTADTTRTYDATYDGATYTYHTMPEITCKLKAQDMANVWLLFMGANPQYYFLSTYAPLLDEKKQIAALDVMEDWSKGADRAIDTKKFADKLAEYLTEIRVYETSDYTTKEKQLFLKLIDDVTYKTGCAYSQSAFSAIVYEEAVCAGYSKAFEMLANYEGYNAITVTSTGHEWNLIQVGKSWYMCDLTTADTNHAYGITPMGSFNTNYEAYKKYFDKDDDPDHEPEKIYDGMLPTLKSDVTSSSEIIMGIKGYVNDNKVTLKKTNTGSIYYTTDGSAPTTSSTRYTAAFEAAEGTVVRAFYKYTYGYKSRELYMVVGNQANWSKGSYYSIKFNANGGKGTVNDMLYTPTGYSVKLVGNNFTKDNLSFAGWNTKADGSGKAYSNRASVKDLAASGGKVTLYAQWKKGAAKKQTITVSKKASKTVTYKASALKKKAASFTINAKAAGKISYKVTKYPSKAGKYITVKGSNGKVTLKKGAKKGTYQITVKAAATSKYSAATKTVTIKVK